MKIENIALEKLTPYARNPREHGENIADLVNSINEFGFVLPLLVDSEMVIIAGHGRFEAAKRLGLKKVDVIINTEMTPEQVKAYRIADNALTERSKWNDEFLAIEIGELKEHGFDIDLTGLTPEKLSYALSYYDGDKSNDKDTPSNSGVLVERFGVPPFSILDARQGYWQTRKKAWLELGIKSELGRKELNNTVVTTKWMKRGNDEGGSIFDPVLCELVYRWFSPDDGMVIDPFAGGSVRGVVASHVGRKYHGVDLRPEQIEANQAQGKKLCKENIPAWYEGDSRDINKILKGKQADLLFSCPPYADLEVYSNNPKDLSTLKYKDFLEAYRSIIKDSCKLLKQDRFACFVVGDIRGKDGNYRNFVSETKGAFLDAGLKLYNEAIYITPIGSLPVRVGTLFNSARKLGKTHQNVLLFIKGNAKRATAALGDVDFGEVEDQDLDIVLEG